MSVVPHADDFPEWGDVPPVVKGKVRGEQSRHKLWVIVSASLVIAGVVLGLFFSLSNNDHGGNDTKNPNR
jgi:hypothetical protein